MRLQGLHIALCSNLGVVGALVETQQPRESSDSAAESTVTIPSCALCCALLPPLPAASGALLTCMKKKKKTRAQVLCALSKLGRRQIQYLTWGTAHSLVNSSYPLQAMHPLSHPIVASLVSSLMGCTRLAWPPFPCLSSPTSLLGPKFVNVFLTCKQGHSQCHIYSVKAC